MKGKDGTSSPLLLSPKVRVKPLKRRRIRLGNADNELDESTLEILNAIRDIPSCCDSKSSSRKPLPAIGSQRQHETVDYDFAIDSNCSTSRDKKISSLSTDVQLIDDALLQSKDVGNDGTKISLRPRRRRERTFISSNKSNFLTADGHSNGTDLNVSNQLNFDNDSVFSDFSEDLTKEKSERRRRNRKSTETESLKDDGAIDVRPAIKAGRRSTRLLESANLQFSFLQDPSNDHQSSNHHNNEHPDTSRSSVRKGQINEDFLLLLDQDTLHGIESNSVTSSETSKTEVLSHKRRSRRHHQNIDEDFVNAGKDDGFSEATSVFSDISESYDPTISSKEHRTRKVDSLSSFGTNIEDRDSDGGIFTSPQRHKKRSRHHQSKLRQNHEDNPLFSNDTDLLATNSFSLSGESDDALYQERKLISKPQRRRNHKYLPPLSENLNTK